MSIKLTELAFCAGCAAKLRAEVLMDVINPFGNVFNQADYPDLLIGLEKADDALNKGIDIARRSDDAIYLSKFHFHG